jgi:hypothetical protein
VVVIRLVLGIACTLLGLLLLGSMVRIKILSCTRLEPSQIDCLLQMRVLGFIPLKTTPVIGLQGAKVKAEQVTSTREDSSGRQRTETDTVYTAILLTQAGEVALDVSTSGWLGSRQKRVEQINAFIHDAQAQSLRVYSDLSHLFLIWLPFLMLAIGLVLLYKPAKLW